MSFPADVRVVNLEKIVTASQTDTIRVDREVQLQWAIHQRLLYSILPQPTGTPSNSARLAKARSTTGLVSRCWQLGYIWDGYTVYWPHFLLPFSELKSSRYSVSRLHPLGDDPMTSHWHLCDLLYASLAERRRFARYYAATGRCSSGLINTVS